MEIRFYGECNCAARTACAPAFGVPLHGLGCPAGTANEQWLWRELSGERAERERARARAVSLEKALRDALDQLTTGFIACARCGDQQDTATMDVCDTIREALAGKPAAAAQEPKR